MSFCRFRASFRCHLVHVQHLMILLRVWSYLCSFRTRAYIYIYIQLVYTRLFICDNRYCILTYLQMSKLLKANVSLARKDTKTFTENHASLLMNKIMKGFKSSSLHSLNSRIVLNLRSPQNRFFL